MVVLMSARGAGDEESAPTGPVTPLPRRIRLGATTVHLVDRESAMAVVGRRLDAGGRPLAVASANLDHVHHFGVDGKDPAAATGGPEWLVLLDGAPLVWRARLLTGRSWPRLAGADLLPDLLALASRTGVRVGFLGGTPEAQARLATALATRLPTLDVGGFWAPPRSDITDPTASAELARVVKAAGIRMLIVGLGKPRQEEWIAAHAEATGASVLVAFGAAADFLAGRVRRAPTWMQRSGLEWLYRLAREPRRLARRYLVQGPPAVVRVVARSGPLPWAGPVAPLPPAGPLCSVIVTYNSAERLPALLDGLAGTPVTHVVVVDNCSTDTTVKVARERQGDPFRLTVVESPENGGYAAGVNLGRAAAPDGAWLLVLNPDVRLRPGAVEALLGTIRAGVGVAVPTLVDPHGGRAPSLRREPSVTRALGDALLGSRVRRGRPGWTSETVHDARAYETAQDVDWATGAAMLVSPDCADAVGPWDETFFLYSEETDFCRRARAHGFAVRFVPGSVVEHEGGGSGRSLLLDALAGANRVRYYAKHHGPVATTVFRACVGLDCLLRAWRPSARLTLRLLTSPDPAATLGLRPPRGTP